MTPKQEQLLKYLEAHFATGTLVAPSFAEMRDALGLASKSGVHRMMDALEEQGFVRRDRNRARRIELIPQGHDLTDVPLQALYAELHRRGELMARAA